MPAPIFGQARPSHPGLAGWKTRCAPTFYGAANADQAPMELIRGGGGLEVFKVDPDPCAGFASYYEQRNLTALSFLSGFGS
ncbi:MAG: hypothetical protein JSS35_17770 [Proteobacteria bacterium]|nr:hypothetical protein [Pseudomonadota bacterium]